MLNLLNEHKYINGVYRTDAQLSLRSQRVGRAHLDRQVFEAEGGGCTRPISADGLEQGFAFEREDRHILQTRGRKERLGVK